MKCFKVTFIAVFTLLFSAVFSGCETNHSEEFSDWKSFEYHFYPEEYEKDYSKFQKSCTLETDTSYQLKIESNCESGIIEICVDYKDGKDKVYVIKPSVPCSDTILLGENIADEIMFTIIIQPNTKGDVFVEILADSQ